MIRRFIINHRLKTMRFIFPKRKRLRAASRSGIDFHEKRV
jgi:hypothetical protein